jgi:hypothetical protein
MAVLTQDQIDLLKERMRNLGRGARGSKQIEALRNDSKIKKILDQLKGYSKDDNLSTADINIPPGFIERTRKVFGTSGDQLPGSKYRKAPKRMTSQEAEERKKVQAPKPRVQAPKPSKLVEREVPTAAVDKLKSVSRAMPPSQEALERKDIKMVKKSPEKFLGLFEMDEKQKSMEDFLKEMSSINKAGGSIRKKKMKKGGAVKVRKANCKRGQGKALRGY